MTYAYPYPASLDSFGVKTDNVSTCLASGVNNAQNAVGALELKVGRDNSADTYSMDYKIGNFWTEQTRKMFFYMVSAPTGWSTAGLATNCVVGVKGGSGVWDVVGSTFYDTKVWYPSDMVYDIHNHCWWRHGSSHPYQSTYDADGIATIGWTDDNQGQAFCSAVRGKVGNYTNTDGDRNYVHATSMWTVNDSHIHTFDGNWRPYAAVGLLAKYVGA